MRRDPSLLDFELVIDLGPAAELDAWHEARGRLGPRRIYTASIRQPIEPMKRTATARSVYEIRPLGAATWDAFADLAEKHNGVWGGCWCTWFHPACGEKGKSSEGNRTYKERLVREGKAHAALVFDGDVAVAWCQYGSPDELPSIYHLKEYTAGLTGRRITASLASSSTGTTGAKASQPWHFVAPLT